MRPNSGAERDAGSPKFLSKAMFAAALRRERALAERGGFSFAVLSFRPSSDQRPSSPALHETLVNRARPADLSGSLGDGTLGMLVRHVTEAEAIAIAEELVNELGPNTHTCTVYGFPPFPARPRKPETIHPAPRVAVRTPVDTPVTESSARDHEATPVSPTQVPSSSHSAHGAMRE